MVWRVEFATPASRELDKLDRQVACRILAFLHDRVVAQGDPRGVGQALKGDYRVIVDIEDSVLRVLLVRVGNRKDVYR